MSASNHNLKDEDESQLMKHKKDELVLYIKQLRGKIEEIESIGFLRKRLEVVERNNIRSEKYALRDTIEISNTPVSIKDSDIEAATVDILGKIGAKNQT